MIFKGCKGVESISNLKKDLFLDCQAVVHMGVISSCMGARLQTSQCCYLENRVMEEGWIRVESRTPDQCNIVRLSVKDWTGFLTSSFPKGNDMVITSKGSVVHRLSWDCLLWDEKAEREVLLGCQRVIEAIARLLD
jgi:hypothetical protein